MKSDQLSIDSLRNLQAFHLIFTLFTNISMPEYQTNIFFFFIHKKAVPLLTQRNLCALAWKNLISCQRKISDRQFRPLNWHFGSEWIKTSTQEQKEITGCRGFCTHRIGIESSQMTNSIRLCITLCRCVLSEITRLLTSLIFFSFGLNFQFNLLKCN